MTQTAEIVVVGAGALGSSIAYHLAVRGVTNVVVLDRGGVASGPTGASSAIIRQNYSNEVTARLALESLRVFQHFGELTGGECGYRQTGCLSLATEQEAAALDANVRMQRGVGIDVRPVTHAEIREIEPHLSLEGVAAGTYEPAAGYADPTLTASGFMNRARELGGRAALNTPVLGLRRDGERIAGVETAAGPIEAPVVVVAAGPWTNTLLNPLGVSLPIEVTRHGVYVYERPAEFHGLHAVIGDFPQGIYIRAEGPDLTLVGSLDTGPEEDVDPDNFARQVSMEEAAEYGEKLIARYPVMQRAGFRPGWASVYDVTPDWHPVLDAVDEVPGLYVAAGTSGHGFKLSPAIGRHMAGLVVGDAEMAATLRPFRRDRFATGALIRGRYAHSIVG